MTLLNQRVSVGFTDQEWDILLQIKAKDYLTEPMAQVVKDVILKGLEVIQAEQEAADAPDD